MSKVDKTIKNLEHCQCRACPSFGITCKIKAVPGDIAKLATGIDKAEHFEGMFCAFEKSNCIHEEHGCKCSGCGVAHDYHLEHDYYCMNNVQE